MAPNIVVFGSGEPPQTAGSAARENGAVIHEDRRRAGSFGEDAAQYDRSRPSYPSQLVDDLMADSPQRVLDVGCGTGIAGRLFSARGCDVLGVEPDPRMAEVARGHGLAVEVSTFEQWDPHGRTFDLLISGQAWHWVHPLRGPAKAAGILAPGGRLAAFWNYGSHTPDVSAAFDRVYESVAPELRGAYALGKLPPDDGGRKAIDAEGHYEPTEVRTYEWRRRYTRDEWLDQLPTHSDHRLLPPKRLAALLEAVGKTIDDLGGSIVVSYRTQLITARRQF